MSLRFVTPDRVLAQNILDERGRVLLARGVKLTPTLIRRLTQLGIGSVCVEDGLTRDLNPREFVMPETRQAVLQTTYQSLNELATGEYTKYIRPPRMKQRFRPVLSEVIDQLKSVDGVGEYLGTVYLSDGELYHHSVNVTFFALSIAIGMGLDEEDLIDLGTGALLHDVGKLKIPEQVLKKPGKLSDEEFEVMKLHTNYGYELLMNVPDLNDRSMYIALEHHERLNGTGYPRGLMGDEIGAFSRISAVADVYEALTANRVYRSGYLPHQALELLLGAGGTHFDPAVVDAFVRTIAVYPRGMTVILSNGLRAVVIRSIYKQTQRPVVRVIENADGDRLEHPWEIDLSSELTLEIVGCET